MRYGNGPGSGQTPCLSIAFSARRILPASFAGIGLLLALVFFFMAGCGNGDAETVESRKYTPHDAMGVHGESLGASYLKISSTVDGEAAVSVTNGGLLTLHDATIWKVGDEAEDSQALAIRDGGKDDSAQPSAPAPDKSGADNAFPGPSFDCAGVFAGTGGKISLENVSIETTVAEGSGLYASGEGAAISLVNGTITTGGSTAHGVLVTQMGKVAVENVTIITKGEHSSALATYRSGGIVTAVGGTYTAFGKYSAGIYSAGRISVAGVVCKSELDNAAVLEGGSQVILKDSVLWARQKGAVMLFQSAAEQGAGDASRFEMTGGTISADDGPIFYATNTTGSIFLRQVALYGASGVLLKALKGTWDVDLAWASPIRGGTVTLTAENQILPGDIVADEFSTVVVLLRGNSVLTGAINTDNHGRDIRLAMDADSTWQVTADSHLTALTFSEGIPKAGITNIIGNGHTVFYGRDNSPALGGRVYDLPKAGRLMPI